MGNHIDFYYKKAILLFSIITILLISILLFYNKNIFATSYPSYSSSCPGYSSYNSPIYNGQSSVSLTAVGDGNSYTVSVSNSSPYYITYYSQTCTETVTYCNTYGYNSAGQYVCTSTGTYSYTYPESYQTTTDVSGGPITLSETSNNSGYLLGLVSTSISCPGSYSNTVSVNNGAVLSYDDGTSGPALSGVNLSAYTSSGSYCNGGSAGTVNPDLRDSIVTMTLNQKYQDVTPGSSNGSILTYYSTPSCNGGSFTECQNTNVLGQFTEKPQYNTDQSQWLIPNPPSTVTYNCSMQSQSPNTTIIINNAVLKTLHQGSGDGGIDRSNIGYNLTDNCKSTNQVVMEGSPALHHPDTDTQSFNLILTPNSTNSFNTEQHGSNPDGAIIYTVSTNCNNQTNFGECQNNNKDGYWKITSQSSGLGGGWLQLYDSKSIAKLSSIYVYCKNSTGPINDQLTTSVENGSAYIGYNCYANPKNLKFWVKSYTYGKGLGAKVSHIGTLNLSNPGSRNIIENPSSYTTKLNIYAPWMQIIGVGNSYSRGGYNIAIPVNAQFTVGVLEWANGISQFENGSNTGVHYQGSVGMTQGNLAPVYDFNFFATLYCEIHGCSNGVYSNGLIEPQNIQSNIPNFTSILPMSTKPTSGNWFYVNTADNCTGTYSIGQTTYSGSAVVLVCGNVLITPNLYPQSPSCTTAGFNPTSSVQNCPGLVIIASGNITINSTTPQSQFHDNDLDANTNTDATIQEGSAENGSGISTLSSNYDIVDAFLVSMGQIILNN